VGALGAWARGNPVGPTLIVAGVLLGLLFR
jgi:hypothetical protein